MSIDLGLRSMLRPSSAPSCDVFSHPLIYMALPACLLSQRHRKGIEEGRVQLGSQVASQCQRQCQEASGPAEQCILCNCWQLLAINAAGTDAVANQKTTHDSRISITAHSSGHVTCHDPAQQQWLSAPMQVHIGRGQVTDTYHIKDDFVHLNHNGGIHLYENILIVLAVRLLLPWHAAIYTCSACTTKFGSQRLTA